MEDVDRLLARVQERDAGAFEEVYNRYHKLVYGIAYRILADGAGAEDLTQTVFLKLWSSPDAYRTGNFGAWISRVARNRALDALRSRSQRSEDELPGDMPIDRALDDTVFAHLDAERVRSALGNIPSEQRTAIELGFFGGITHEQIAERTKAPLGTVKTRIRMGLRKLRVLLED